MTAASLAPARPAAEWSASQAIGRVLTASGLAFGGANLFQWGVLSGALPLHPAWLSLSWPVALAVFFTVLVRVRRNPSPGARVAGRWSRLAVFSLLGVVALVAAVSAASGDWGLMAWATVAIPAMYGVAWTTAAVRSRRLPLILPALAAVAGAAAIAHFLGTPSQYLAASATQVLTALIPGLLLVTARPEA